MQTKYVLGIDTSNYTTSAALMSLDGDLIANVKRPLPVKTGECGLRQSDAVFAHVKNLPSLMEEIRSSLGGASPIAIGVSSRPRNIDGSYMPCFLSGVGAASAIAAACDLPIYEFSHQCGHIMAAIYGSGREDLLKSTFCAFHVSGGTTEMLRVTPARFSFRADLVGGTKDLNAGQVIDRIGVHMGLPFPSGAHIEKLADACTERPLRRKISIDGLKINLSGLENMAKKYLSDGKPRESVARFVLDYIAESLLSLARAYQLTYGESDFLFAGGVMSNGRIREHLTKGVRASFAPPALSADNAVGIAALARRRYLCEHS